MKKSFFILFVAFISSYSANLFSEAKPEQHRIPLEAQLFWEYLEPKLEKYNRLYKQHGLLVSLFHSEVHQAKNDVDLRFIIGTLQIGALNPAADFNERKAIISLLISAEKYIIFLHKDKLPPLGVAKILSRIVYDYPLLRYICHRFQFGSFIANARWREKKLFNFLLSPEERFIRLQELYQQEQELKKKSIEQK